MPAHRSAAFRRTLAAVTALPLLALAACGYGSESTDAKTDKVAAGAEKIDGLDTVNIGYFGNLTHATALVGIQKGFFQKELGATKAKYTTFNAGPSEIEALNGGSIDIGWIGPSPAINGYTKADGANLRIIGGSASGGVKLVVNPDKIKSTKDIKGKKDRHPAARQHAGRGVPQLDRGAGLEGRREHRQGRCVRGPHGELRHPGRLQVRCIDGAWVPEPTASKLVAEGAKVLLDEADLWPDKKFVITNIIVRQEFLKEHPDVVEAVLRGSVKTNAFIVSDADAAKAAANAQLKADSGKELPADVLDPAWKSIQFINDPLASTLQTEADHAVKAGLLENPKLDGIYDLTLLNKVLKAEGDDEVSDAGLGVK